MTTAQLWDFVHTHGVKSGEIVAFLLGLLSIVFSAWYTLDTLSKPSVKWIYRDVIGPVLIGGVGLAMLFACWGLLRERYLLEPGGGQYTIGFVYKYTLWRGINKYICIYIVNGVHYQTDAECGMAQMRDLPCPKLNSRRFICFAPEDPNKAIILVIPVPDTLRTIPPLGWAKLP